MTYLLLSFLLGVFVLLAVVALASSQAEVLHPPLVEVEELMSRELAREQSLMENHLRLQARSLLAQEQSLSGEALPPEELKKS